jgi:hypothetical protein
MNALTGWLCVALLLLVIQAGMWLLDAFCRVAYCRAEAWTGSELHVCFEPNGHAGEHVCVCGVAWEEGGIRHSALGTRLTDARFHTAAVRATNLDITSGAATSRSALYQGLKPNSRKFHYGTTGSRALTRIKADSRTRNAECLS